MAEPVTSLSGGHKLFINNPDLIKYFFENADIKESDPNYGRAAATASLMLDYFDTARVVAQYTSQLLPHSQNDTIAWDHFFVSTLRSSPILCKRYLQTINEYGETLRQIAEPACSSKKGQ
jgi:hypothetical protein